MARPRIYLSIGLEDPRRIRRMGCRAALPNSRHPCYRSQGRTVRRSAQRRAQASTVQAVRQGVHAGATNRRTHGFDRGLMRSILQLRTSEGSSHGDTHRLGGLNGRSAVESVRPAVRFQDSQIEMAHGAGGKASRRLVEGLFAPILCGASTEPLGDAAHIDISGTRIAMTTDAFVVRPLSFPGGSIGELAVNGTVNDLAVSGARAVALVCSYVLEAGLPADVLEAEVRAMAAAAQRAGVSIVGGDTKVVEHGKADRMYITTTGIGRRIPELTLAAGRVRPGDQVIL